MVSVLLPPLLGRSPGVRLYPPASRCCGPFPWPRDLGLRASLSTGLFRPTWVISPGSIRDLTVYGLARTPHLLHFASPPLPSLDSGYLGLHWGLFWCGANRPWQRCLPLLGLGSSWPPRLCAALVPPGLSSGWSCPSSTGIGNAALSYSSVVCAPCGAGQRTSPFAAATGAYALPFILSGTCVSPGWPRPVGRVLADLAR